jgi:hypothetical protein
MLEALQRFAMPRTLPDGRTESPGVLRIYLASMIILAGFYACSAVMQVLGARGTQRTRRGRALCAARARGGPRQRLQTCARRRLQPARPTARGSGARRPHPLSPGPLAPPQLMLNGVLMALRAVGVLKQSGGGVKQS